MARKTRKAPDRYIQCTEYIKILDGIRNQLFLVPDTTPMYISFRRRLHLLGMRMMVITAKQRGIKVTDYPNVRLGFVNPKTCPDLAYEYLGKNHIKIYTIFGDVGEIKEYFEDGEEGQEQGVKS